ncbi:MAG TPA: adenylosuccinate lyase [Caldisericia bacterium]|nr:adenylosuccinate lyase [Caldisericia bacterium]
MIKRYTLQNMKNVWSEETKFSKMLEIELLICEAWNKLGKIPDNSLLNIKSKAKFNIERIKEIEKITNHDVIAFVTNVSENIGDDGRFIHMGATSSDILDTALALQMRDAVDILIDDLLKLKDALREKAIKYKNLLTIGRTHGIHAEPTSFGLKFALWFTETKKNIERMIWVKDEISIGKLSGAVGNFANTDPFVEEYVLNKLNLKPALVSTQIIQRDVHALLLNIIALIGSSLDKYALEIRNLQRTEVSEVSEPFTAGQKGSSAMPHKKNPIICERICGLARVLRGYSITSLENIPLWHERDISHSSAERIILPDATTLLDYMINKFIFVVNDLEVYDDKILKNVELTKGRYNSERVLTYLIEEKGFSREKAYQIVQNASFESLERDISFKDALREENALNGILKEEEIDNLFDLKWFIRYVDYIYKRSGIEDDKS